MLDDLVPGILEGSTLDFRNLVGSSLSDRHQSFRKWVLRRDQHGSWPYGRVLAGRAGDTVSVLDKNGQNRRECCINFGSQDYLSLAQDSRLHDAAIEAIQEFGVHSAGSPALCGRTTKLTRLESFLADKLRKPHGIVLPTGWAAGYGTITSLVREDDIVVMDKLSHNCLTEGAYRATRNVYRFAHNDLDALLSRLTSIRQKYPSKGVFVVVESLYSMDADSPNLSELIKITKQFEAVSIVDVAHDFGCMGAGGIGALAELSDDCWPDVILGSFSKTFGANGGFIVGPECLQDYLLMYAPSQTFSNAISPIQTGIVSKACEIVFSPEGDTLRMKLAKKVDLLRSEMSKQGMDVRGMPCPIVPVFVGDEKLARLTYKALSERRILANMVEHPGVAKGQARFRFQVMANHKAEDIISAAQSMRTSREEAAQELLSLAPCALVEAN